MNGIEIFYFLNSINPKWRLESSNYILFAQTEGDEIKIGIDWMNETTFAHFARQIVVGQIRELSKHQTYIRRSTLYYCVSSDEKLQLNDLVLCAARKQ